MMPTAARRGWRHGALALALLFTACGSGAGAPASVVIGIVGVNTADWPIFLAESQGYFKGAGLQVQEVLTGGPAQAAEQLASGSVDLASDGTDTYVRSVSQRLPITIVAPEFITDPYSLVTVPSVTSWQDLKGRTVILGTTTDVTAISFDAMAAAQGLTQKDFTVLTAGSTNARYAALKSGHVQAAMLTQPFDILAASQGLRVLATSKQYVPNWIFTTLGVNTRWAKSHSAQVSAVLRALESAIRFGYTHPSAAVAVMAQRSKVPQAEVQRAYDLDFTQWRAFSPTLTVEPVSLRAVVQTLIRQGTIKQAPAASALYDPSYVQRARGH
jgi:NitT/TauT family transport system substrate-binding protein